MTRGYRVKYLGIQNRLEEFFGLAAMCNVVMLSSMDGHTRYYLREFPELMKRFRSHRPLWYLGGNLTVGDACGFESYFMEMGFDRVFVKFTDVSVVLDLLARDLHGVEAVADYPTLWERSRNGHAAAAGAVADEVLDPSEFERARREVLAHWKTGHLASDLRDNAEFLARQPSFPAAQRRSAAGGPSMLIQPRSGVPLLADQIKLFRAFKGAGASVLSYQVDSLTRNNNYAGAEEAIRESRTTGDSTLNGFPVINHGPAGLRRIISEVGLPLQTRHSTRDPRLLAEISYAGGVTAFEGGPVCYNIPYYKDYTLGESIETWRYVDRLTGLYHERFGITLDREFFGTLTATLIPPCLAIAVNILEAVLAVQQGVKCVSLGYAEQGNRIQDIAAIRAMGEMGAEVLANLGHFDVHVNTVFHQYMAAFPEDQERAEGLIYNSAITARLSRATRVIVKTPAEAFKVPTLEDNVHALHLVRMGAGAAREQGVCEERVSEECALIRRETQAVLDSVVAAGRGQIAPGIVEGFRRGLLDIPFAPSVYNRGEVMTARDNEGAVRFLSIGRLGFDAETRQFHEHRMAERRAAEGMTSGGQNYLLVERDVMRVPRCDYARWPLFG
jgi:methylaspartate mutase epsilon subunit